MIMFAEKENNDRKSFSGVVVTPHTLFENVSKEANIKNTLRRIQLENPKLLKEQSVELENIKNSTANQSLSDNYITPRTIMSSIFDQEKNMQTVKVINPKHKRMSPQLKTSQTSNSSSQESGSNVNTRKKRRRTVDLKKNLKPLNNPEDIGDEVYEKISHLKKKKTELASFELNQDLSGGNSTAMSKINWQSSSSEQSQTFRNLQRKRQKRIDLRNNLLPITNTKQLSEELFNKIMDLKKRENISMSRQSLMDSISKAQSSGINSSLVSSNLEKLFKFDQSVSSIPQKTDDKLDLHLSDDMEEESIHTAIDSTRINFLSSTKKDTEVHEGYVASISSISRNQDLHYNSTHRDNKSTSIIDVVPPSVQDVANYESPLRLHESFLRQDSPPIEVESSKNSNSTKASMTKNTTKNDGHIEASNKIKQRKMMPSRRGPSLLKMAAVLPKRKTTSKPETLFIPLQQMKGILEHYSNMKFTKEALFEANKIFNVFFKQLCQDLDAVSDHAGRNSIDLSDFEVIMKRQRVITKDRPLRVLIEEIMPMEYREKLLTAASSKMNK